MSEEKPKNPASYSQATKNVSNNFQQALKGDANNEAGGFNEIKFKTGKKLFVDQFTNNNKADIIKDPYFEKYFNSNTWQRNLQLQTSDIEGALPGSIQSKAVLNKKLYEKIHKQPQLVKQRAITTHDQDPKLDSIDKLQQELQLKYTYEQDCAQPDEKAQIHQHLMDKYANKKWEKTLDDQAQQGPQKVEQQLPRPSDNTLLAEVHEKHEQNNLLEYNSAQAKLQLDERQIEPHHQHNFQPGQQQYSEPVQASMKDMPDILDHQTNQANQPVVHQENQGNQPYPQYQPRSYSNAKYRMNPTYFSFLSNVNDPSNPYSQAKFDIVANQIIKTQRQNQAQQAKPQYANIQQMPNNSTIQIQDIVQQQQQHAYQQAMQKNLPSIYAVQQKQQRVPQLSINRIQNMIENQKLPERLKTETDAATSITLQNQQIQYDQMMPMQPYANSSQVYTQRNIYATIQPQQMDKNFYAGVQNFTGRQPSQKPTSNYYGPHALKNLSNKNLL